MRGFWMAVAALIAIPAGSASAATALYNLSVTDPSAGIAAGPYGTVKVEESGGSLIFTETLFAGFRIHDGNSNHNAFAFSLVGAPVITISDLTSGFAQVAAATVDAPPFGSFDYGIDCTGCGPGYAGGNPGPLSFKVTAASGSLTLGSLSANSYKGLNIFFTSGIVDSAGKTGNAGAVFTSVSSVPEPATWATMLVGFGAVGAMLRRHARRFAIMV